MDATYAIVVVGPIVALCFTFSQLIVPVYTMVYDFRCFSSRTKMGGWARLAYRRWIWKEARFEFTFSTPRIEINPRPAGLTMKDDKKLAQQDYNGYEFRRAPNREGPESLEPPWSARNTSKPWFLCAQGAAPVAKCSWLALLEDTVLANLRVRIDENVSSLDFVPTDFTRPFASADRRSFLTLMTLFGVRWKNGGKDGKLTGAGEFCEVFLIKNVNYGSVFVYHSDINVNNNRTCRWRFYLESEQARLAMFNCFDLGFATIKTHDNAELAESLLGMLSPEIVEQVLAHGEGLDEWYPILSEAIACWAYESMPKMVDSVNDNFKSVFSADFARCKLGSPQFVRALLHYEVPRGDLSTASGDLAVWVMQYLNKFSEVKQKVHLSLKWAARNEVNNLDRRVPWSVSLRSLRGIRELDSHLCALIPNSDSYIASVANRVIQGDVANMGDSMMPMEWDDAIALESTRENLLGLFFVRQQFKHGFPSTTKEAIRQRLPSAQYAWPSKLDPVENKRYTTIVERLRPLLKLYLSKSNGLAENVPLAEWIIANRVIRGVLWMVHNGNAFDQSKKTPRCNLSSIWLEDNPTVYIS